jgi:hypothetical protein
MGERFPHSPSPVRFTGNQANLRKQIMQNAFKTKAKQAATEFNIETAKRLIKPTLLRQPVVAMVFNSFPPRVRASANVRIAEFSDVVFITVVMHDLDSFKDTKLTNLLAKFTDDGWRASTSDFVGADVPNRDFSFTRRFAWEHDPRAIAYKKLVKENATIPQTFEIIVNISAWVKSDSPTCRIVTKESEETVKKVEKFIVCN